MSDISTGKQILVLGWTLSLFLLVSYLICIGFGIVAPDWAHMHEAWAPWLPGFEWLTWLGFLAGAVGSFTYGWYIALFVIPLRRFFEKRIGNSANG